jgi:lincosamide nucleotidyltransferase A/C/D/E
MPLETALDLLNLADELEVEFWINCGWAVDATLGRQTPRHRDLDILIDRRDEPRLAEALRQRGFQPRRDEDAQPWSYVLADDYGHEVDVHVIQRLLTGGWSHGPEGGPPEQLIAEDALKGTGQICGHQVRCPTPETLVRWRTGYVPADRDWSDVSALCRRFGIDIPDDYRTFHDRG